MSIISQGAFELTSVMIRQMPVELVKTPAGWKHGPTTSGTSLANLTAWFVNSYISLFASVHELL